MAFSIVTSDKLSGGGKISDPASGVSQSANFGSGVLPAITYAYSAGTGAGQVNAWFLGTRTAAATSHDDVDLSALVSLGTTYSLTKLKRVFVGIIAPDGAKKLRVGPQGVTHGAQLWFQDVTTNFWEETFNYVLKDNPVNGWDVTAGSADVLGVYNPGATDVDYALWILGLD